jgi:hypothetical protein
MKDSTRSILFRIVLRLWPLAILPGCGEPEGPREVPITRSSHPQPDPDGHPVTKAPRAIATH